MRFGCCADRVLAAEQLRQLLYSVLVEQLSQLFPPCVSIAVSAADCRMRFGCCADRVIAAEQLRQLFYSYSGPQTVETTVLLWATVMIATIG